jgi:ABC-type Na+ efflux pump permease subunit
MKAVWALARKELRLLLRDRLAAGLLLFMPLLFILVLGLLVGESFGQKPDDTLRLSIVDLDTGVGLNGKPWAYQVRTDLIETPGIRLETITTREEAEALVRDHKRPAVLILGPTFSERINRCSFLDLPGSINPFHREGVHLDPDSPQNPEKIDLGVRMLKDSYQSSTAAIIEQVVQVTMLRVILPHMIGQAFKQLSEPRFIDRLGEEVKLPVPEDFPELVGSAEALLKDSRVRAARLFDRKLDKTLQKLEAKLKTIAPMAKRDRMKLAEMIQLASGKDEKKAAEFRAKVGDGVQKALEKQFNKYDLTGMTWAALTRARPTEGRASVTPYVNTEGSGLLKRGAHRYQILVPAYTVMFAFFLVLTVGWVFVAERRQGTLKRLRAAPLSRAQILVGKLLPCYLVSVMQGIFLLVAGRLLFGMPWGPREWSLPTQAGWLLLVVLSTSLAAMGLALLVAAVAKTEMQVALFGAVPVLVLALIGGCVLPREMMPEQTQKLSLITPQGWALDAYRELLTANTDASPPPSETTSAETTIPRGPNLKIVMEACGVLGAFGVFFLALAWGLLRLD